MCAKREGQLIIDDRWSLPYHIRVSSMLVESIIFCLNGMTECNFNLIIHVLNRNKIEMFLPKG